MIMLTEDTLNRQDETEREFIRERLLSWYDEHKRDLPWRAKNQTLPDPYNVWLSEIMLQQTTVITVLNYYNKFIEKWPNFISLAAAKDDDIMAQWAGLGYYSRARNLLKTARIVAETHKGVLPSGCEDLKKLPGLGPYSIAAIQSFAFGLAANVIDGNVERLFSRLYALNKPISDSKKDLIYIGKHFVSELRASDWPQAMMDFAQMICKPKKPLCAQCPISNKCLAYLTTKPEGFPIKGQKATKPKKMATAYLIHDDERVLCEVRNTKGLLGGMLGLPHTDIIENALHNNNILHMFEQQKTVDIGTVSHIFTHFHLTMKVKEMRISSDHLDHLSAQDENYKLVAFDQIGRFPRLFQKALELKKKFLI